MTEHVKPPLRRALQPQDLAVFLAGAIDMGAAEDWQETVYEHIEAKGVVTHVFNPRRDDWDSSWQQHNDDPQFNSQVHWEQDAIEAADIVVVYFTPTSKAPITLMELGQLAGCPVGSKKTIVYCPDEFYRKGNVDIVCERAGIPVYNNENDFLHDLSLFIDGFDEVKGYHAEMNEPTQRALSISGL